MESQNKSETALEIAEHISKILDETHTVMEQINGPTPSEAKEEKDPCCIVDRLIDRLQDNRHSAVVLHDRIVTLANRL